MHCCRVRCVCYRTLKENNHPNKVQNQGPIILTYLLQLTTFHFLITLHMNKSCKTLSTIDLFLNCFCHIVLFTFLVVFIFVFVDKTI